MQFNSRIVRIPEILFKGISFYDIFNSRQRAIIIWAIGLLILVLIFPKGREGLITILKALKSVLVQPVFKFLLIYLVIFTVILLLLNIPSVNFVVVKDYVMLYFFTLIPYLVKVKQGGFYRALFKSVGIGAVLLFLLSAYPLSFGLEMVFSPLVVSVLIINALVDVKGPLEVAKFTNSLIGIVIIGLLINSAIHFALDLRNGGVSLNFFEGFLIEPVMWVVNIPLIVLAIPMMQFDLLDNFRTSKKTALRIFFESLSFLLAREYHRPLLLSQPRRAVEDVHISRGAIRRIRITVREGTSLAQVQQIQSMYRWMLAPQSDYQDHVRIIPISVESRISGDSELAIQPYEINHLQEDYKFEKYAL